ncbi:unnamed protein product [Effrenium voratum]|uniref:C2 domain-containing protein n=1 Tax=Effrenium voratum TaxID=2562239 RepID=A0AA36JGT9_9DINO|nr:unnamed protein product [Effrenium voratum]
MNSNNFRDDSLGSVKLDTRSLEPNQWHHYRLKLEEGQGGELEFDAYLKPAQPCKPLSRKDELIGQAEVSMEKFYPHGFEGALPLQLNDKPTEGLVHVFIEVEPKGVKLKSGHRRASSQMSIASVGSLPSRTPSASAVARARSQASAGQASVSERPAPGSLGEAEKSVLQIRINEAMNLTNRDSGLFGDVSDPYVVVRAAGVEQKTPTINNNLNPVWEGDNLFSFNIGAEDHKVEFEACCREP